MDFSYFRRMLSFVLLGSFLSCLPMYAMESNNYENYESGLAKDFTRLDYKDVPNNNIDKSVAINLSLNVLVVSDSKDLSRKFCGLLSVNQKNKPLGEIMKCRKDWLPGIVYAPNNNTNLRFVNFSLDDFLNIDSQKDYDAKFLVDNLSYVFYITDKDNFKLENIKKFYDKLNLIWCGKEIYGEGYSYLGVKKDDWFKKKLEISKQEGKNSLLLHRYIYFILDCDDTHRMDELLREDNYCEIVNYIQGMPDSRAIPMYNFSNNFTLCSVSNPQSISVVDHLYKMANGVPKGGTKECAKLKNKKLLLNDFGFKYYASWPFKKVANFFAKCEFCVINDKSFNDDGEDFFH